MRRRRLLRSVWLLMVVSACSPIHPSVALTVRVVDARTGGPIAGAIVQFETGAGENFSRPSDDSGQATGIVTSWLGVRVTVSKPGYVTTSTTLDLMSADSTITVALPQS